MYFNGDLNCCNFSDKYKFFLLSIYFLFILSNVVYTIDTNYGNYLLFEYTQRLLFLVLCLTNDLFT